MLFATFGLRAASAQTVLVQSAPPGSTVEVTLNGTSVATAKTDNSGDATLSLGGRTSEAGVLVYIDTCGTQISVHVVNRGVQPVPSPPSCSRTDIGSVFIMQPITTFVVDIGPSPTLHVRQGPPPHEWVLRGPGSAAAPTLFAGKPGTGLAVSVGVGFSKFAGVTGKLCGDATQCQPSNLRVTEAAAAEIWLTRYLAAQVGYLRPADTTASGSGGSYQFDSRVTTRILTVAAKAGVALGPARLYALGGVNRHEATITTNETVNDLTVTVNNVPQTIKGGTQSFGQQTRAWNWLAGGGIEAWSNHWFALYGEVSIAKIKGSPLGGGEGGIDDRMTIGVVGARIHIGR